MSKRIVICSDGTWCTPDREEPTNVVKMARAIIPEAADGVQQVVFYDEGIGSTGPKLSRWIDGFSGRGISKNVQEAYRFLIHNYVDGDEIFFFGFSRGAYTVRSMGGLIRNCGILRKEHADKFQEAYDMYKSEIHPDSEDAKVFRHKYAGDKMVRIKFMGVWDTVGALGIPLRGLRALTMRSHTFHDVELSRYIDHAYHTLAIDEKRGPFKPTLWETKKVEGQVVEQVWFVGVHSNIGGGYEDSGLSDIAFLWMKDKAEESDLVFNQVYIDSTVAPNALGSLRNSKSGLYKLTRSFIRPIGEGKDSEESVHPDATLRHNTDSSYKPENLVRYLKRLLSPEGNT